MRAQCLIATGRLGEAAEPLDWAADEFRRLGAEQPQRYVAAIAKRLQRVPH
jgi:hypothetical protein